MLFTAGRRFASDVAIQLPLVFQHHHLAGVLLRRPAELPPSPGRAGGKNDPPEEGEIELLGAALRHAGPGGAPVLKIPLQRTVQAVPAVEIQKNDPVGLSQTLLIAMAAVVSLDHPAGLLHKPLQQTLELRRIPLLPAGQKVQGIQREERQIVSRGQKRAQRGFSAAAVSDDRDLHLKAPAARRSPGIPPSSPAPAGAWSLQRGQ